MHGLTRRGFLRYATSAALGLGATRMLNGCGGDGDTTAPSGSPSLPPVHAVLGDSLSELHGMGVQAARDLGLVGNALRGATVFIKPNFMHLGLPLPFNPASGDVTKPEIALGIAEQCLRAGAARVTIGEGGQHPDWTWDEVTFLPGNSVYGTTSFTAAVDYLNTAFGNRLELVNLNSENQWDLIPSSSNDPLTADGLLVGRRVVEVDHVISVPCLKNHQWTGMSLSMKCLFGTTPIIGYQMIPGVEPGRYGLHLAYVHATCGGVQDAGVEGAYMDILKWRREQGKQDFAIIDCSIGIEGNGPAGGGLPVTPIPGFGGTTVDIKERSAIGMYFLLASEDMYGADAVATRITGHDPTSMKQLVIGRGLGFGNPNEVRLRGASLDELTLPGWQKAEYVSEWEIAPPAHASGLEPVSWERRMRLVNYLSSLMCPLALIGALRWLQNRRLRVAQVQELEELAENAVRGLGGDPG